MKKFSLILIAIIFLFSSCKKEDEKTEVVYKVAMLAHGNTFDDMSFLQSCKEGIEKAEEDFNIIVEYNIDNSTDRYQERIDSYGEQNFDIIIAIGYMWNDAVTNSSKTYTNSSFVLVDSELSDPQQNAISIVFDVDEAAFPIGYLAAWWADQNDSINPKLGNVGAIPIPQINQFMEPYTNGANRYNLQYNRIVEVANVYVGDFLDAEKGKYLADSLITDGADVIFGVGSEAGDAALLSASNNGKWCFGVDSDQYFSYPAISGAIISSAVKGLGNTIYTVVNSYVDGNFNGGGTYNGMLANDGVKLAPFHDYDALIADSIKNEIETIKAGIIDGNIDTGW